MSDQQPRRVIPPAAATPAAQPSQRPAARPSPAKDFPPLALMFLGFLLGAVGGVLLLMDPLGLKALGIVVAVLGQMCLLTGVIAQGVYIGTAKARDRGLI